MLYHPKLQYHKQKISFSSIIIMSTAESLDQGREEAKGKIVQTLKDMYDNIGELVLSFAEKDHEDPLQDVHVAKSRAMKQWSVKAEDFKNIPAIQGEKSTVYPLKDILMKAEGRLGTGGLLARAFPTSNEKFHCVSKKQEAEDPEGRQYSQTKMKQAAFLVWNKFKVFLQETREKYGQDIVSEAEKEFLRIQEKFVNQSKAAWKQLELEYDDLEAEMNRRPTSDTERRLEQKRSEIIGLQCHLLRDGQDLNLMKKLASFLLYGIVPEDDTSHDIYERCRPKNVDKNESESDGKPKAKDKENAMPQKANVTEGPALKKTRV
jgi:hypothetical protein